MEKPKYIQTTLSDAFWGLAHQFGDDCVEQVRDALGNHQSYWETWTPNLRNALITQTGAKIASATLRAGRQPNEPNLVSGNSLSLFLKQYEDLRTLKDDIVFIEERDTSTEYVRIDLQGMTIEEMIGKLPNAFSELAEKYGVTRPNTVENLA